MTSLRGRSNNYWAFPRRGDFRVRETAMKNQQCNERSKFRLRERRSLRAWLIWSCPKNEVELMPEELVA